MEAGYLSWCWQRFFFQGNGFISQLPGIRAALDSTGIDHARDAGMDAELLRHLLDDRFFFLSPLFALLRSIPQQLEEITKRRDDGGQGSDGSVFESHPVPQNGECRAESQGGIFSRSFSEVCPLFSWQVVVRCGK